MSSARKGSLSSSSSAHHPVPMATLDRRLGPSSEPEADPACDTAWGDAYPPSVPTRSAYLLARSLGVFFALLNIGLASAALRLNRQPWTTPTYTPSFTSFFHHSFDILSVVRGHRRCPRRSRLLFDGALGVAFAIALGFLASFTNGDLKRTRPDSSQATAGVAAAILCGMAVEMLLHSSISVGAIIETLRRRCGRQYGGNQHRTATV